MKYIKTKKQAQGLTTSDLLERLIYCHTRDIIQFETPRLSQKQHKGRLVEQILAIEEILQRSGESKTAEEIELLLRDDFWPEN